MDNTTLIHALLALAIVVAATILRVLDDMGTSTVAYVYSGALGFAAGRSGTRPTGGAR